MGADLKKQQNETSPLKVGVLLDSTDVPAWAHCMLQTIQQGNYATIELIILDDGPPPPVPPSPYPAWQRPLLRLWQRFWQQWVYGLSHRWYRTFIHRDNGKDDAFRPTCINSLLPDVARIQTNTQKTAYVDQLPQADVDAIRKLELDVILRVGFRILHGSILNAAKHGVWSIIACDNRERRGAPACFWETMQSQPTIGSGIQVLSHALDNGKVLYRSTAETDRFSVENNCRNVFWKSQAFMPRLLKRLHREGDAMYEQLRIADDNELVAEVSLSSHTLSSWVYTKLVLQKTLEKIRWILHNKTAIRQWSLMVHHGDDPHTNPWHYKLVQPPKDRIWADPFILQRNERNYVFIEELLVSNNKGHIAVMELDDKGNTTQPVTVLEKDYHLSYPFVFEHDGDTWMIPESSAAQNLSLYRCTSFPNQWEFVMHLMEDIKIVDATLHQQDGLWWLFANVAAHPTLDKRDELHIYFAEDFRTSEWSAHPLNPVVSDVCTARPAGKLFYFEDKLIRPSQNSSHHYGYGYNLHEVQTLTTSQYQEHTIKAVTPNWHRNVVATHTYNSVRGLSVIDAMVVRSRYN